MAGEKAQRGADREAESSDVSDRVGPPRSSDEAGVMLVERWGRVIAVEHRSAGTPGGARGTTEGGRLHAMARAE
jgi:hypothetical protein